jgi:hypothetical protein
MTLIGWLNKYFVLILATFISLIFWQKEAEGRRYFFIKRPMGEAVYSFEFLRDARIRPQNITRDTTTTFGQKPDIFTEGWIYLPGLCSYSIEIEPEWERERNEVQTGEIRKEKRTLRNYNLRAIFLKDKPYTLGIYNIRNNNKLKTNFAPRTITESKGYGAYLLLKYPILPTIMNYDHTETSQSGTFATNEERDYYRLNMRHLKGPSFSLLEYEFDDQTRQVFGVSTNSRRSNLSLRNRYNIREQRKIMLSSTLRYLDISGQDYKSKTLTLSEGLFWTHTDNLRTNYEFLFERTDETSGFSERKNLNVGLVHQLYENLTTSVDLNGDFFNFTGGGDEEIYEANLNFNYQRRIPWGMLNINTGFGYRINDQNNDLEFVEIKDESHILGDPTFNFLERENVVLDSIVVTDLDGNPYIEGVDYYVREVGLMVEIIRISFGHISEGEEVLIDYTARNNPPIKFSTTRQAYGINLFLWRKWRLYYRYNRSKQSFISGFDTGNLITDTTQVLGTEFRWRWSLTKFQFEDRDTTNIPSSRWFIQEDLVFRPFRRLSLSLSGQYNESKFKDTGEMDRSRRFQGNLKWALSSWAMLEAEAYYVKSKGVHKSGIEKMISSRLVWTYAAWEGSIELNFMREKDELVKGLRKKFDFLFLIKRLF